MIFAHMDPAKLPPVPADFVRSMATRPANDIETSFVTAEDQALGAEDWISCGIALPHTDPGWEDFYFVTLSLSSGWWLGDAKRADWRYVASQPFLAGSIAIIDPLVCHWLMPACDDAAPTLSARWFGLQWQVPRRSLSKGLAKVVRATGATVRGIEHVDVRYRKAVMAAGRTQ